MTKQIALLLIIGTITVCAVLAAMRVRHSQHIADPQRGDGSSAARLATGIDPNTADWQMMAILPQLGERRARDIVEYREAHQRIHPDRPAFSTFEDLLLVKGLGVSTVESLKPHLVLPATSPVD